MASDDIEENTALVAPVCRRDDRLSVSARVAVAIPAALAFTAIAIMSLWAQKDGGFAPQQWLPSSLAILGLLIVSVASPAARMRIRGAAVPGLLLGLYVVWNYLSLAWAQVRGDALDGANRTLLYFCVFALFSLLPLSEDLRAILIGAWGIAIAVIGSVELGLAAAASGPQGHFVQGRLASPISYPDANAALFFMAMLPLLVLASRRETHAGLRIVAGAACATLADLGLLGQSRGSLFALPLALLFYLLVSRNALRGLSHLVLVAIAAAPAIPPLLGVYSAVVAGKGYTAAVTDACVWVGASALIGAAGFTAAVAFDRRVRVPEHVRRRIHRDTVRAAAIALVLSIGVLAAFGHPVERARVAWHDFTTNKRAEPDTAHLVSGFGSSRYDVWRIALDQFEQHPFIGVGADNYIVGYLQHRRTGETARYPESVELRALSETGIIGAILFIGFLAAAIRRALIAGRGSVVPSAALAGIAAFGYWMLHASVDWFWEFPALTGPALAFLALAGTGHAPASRMLPSRRIHRPRGTRVLAVTMTAIVVVAAIVVLALPWVALRQTDEAVAIAGTNPSQAYRLLHDAARLNPLSETPDVTEGILAANAGDRVRERRALLAAVERNHSDWYLFMMLGIVAGQQHQLALSRDYLARARRLSPLDQVVMYAQIRLRQGSPLTEQDVGRILLLETASLRGVVQR
jgi:O-antigen ligase/polysaccharide polymerase Wzy-like membrane protein